MRFHFLLWIFLIPVLPCKICGQVVLEAPPDPVVEPLRINSWIQKCNIMLTGKKVTAEELATATNYFETQGFDLHLRDKYIKRIQESGDWTANLINQTREDLLESTSSFDIRERARQFAPLLSDSSLMVFHDIIRANREKLLLIDSLNSGMINEEADIMVIQKYYTDNWFYDEINMGADNFVISTFVHFLKRFPGKFELAEARNMINGFPGILFLKNGKCKQDYLTIFFSSEEYLQCLVINTYQNVLFRQPKPAELVAGLTNLHLGKSYAELLRTLLVSDEFFQAGGVYEE